MANTSMAVVATPLMTHLLGPARPALLAIAGASGALLLIACANAAALLLVHGAGRRREVAVRFALGARRLQIVRQLFCESIVLSLIAGVLGVGLAYVSFGAIVSLAPIDVPRLDEAAIDVRALLFALVLCLGTAVMVGLLPAWRQQRRRAPRRTSRAFAVGDRGRPLPRARASCSWRRNSRPWWCC